MYKTDITPTRWIVYDIFGNVGWIAYYVVLVKCFAEKPEFMQYWGLAALALAWTPLAPAAVAVLATIPALLMLVGLVELISERIQKLDYILPKARVYRGFGALSLGGITGAAVALIGIVYALIVGAGEDICYLYIMLAGGVLCAVFAGLCFKRYKKMPEA